MSDKPLRVSVFFTVCSGCKVRREVRFSSPLLGADELSWWLKNRLEPCATPGCGSGTCDVEVPLAENGIEV